MVYCSDSGAGRRGRIGVGQFLPVVTDRPVQLVHLRLSSFAARARRESTEHGCCHIRRKHCNGKIPGGQDAAGCPCHAAAT